MRSRSPIARSVTTIEERPKETSGSVSPFVGTSATTTIMFTSACTPIQTHRPKQRNIEKRTLPLHARKRPRPTITASRHTTSNTPSRPSSSPTTAKMKSV
jgi:hypothetical protein